MLVVVRKDKVMIKKAIELKAASCVKEWLGVGAPKVERMGVRFPVGMGVGGNGLMRGK